MTLSVVDGPAITWITPQSSACAAKKETLGVLASDTSRITGVAFLDGARKVATDKTGVADIYAAAWKTSGLARGRHVLHAVVTDRAGHKTAATRTIRVC